MSSSFFLTHGLRAGSVHHAWLRVGEELVGDIVALERPLTLMFPMVAEWAEQDCACEIFGLELERMQKWGMTPIPNEVRVGVMIKVPSLAVHLASLADFVSIGTNDLARHFFASYRTSSRLANRYDTLAPQFLELLRQIRAQCEAAGVLVCWCAGVLVFRLLDAETWPRIPLRRPALPDWTLGPCRSRHRPTVSLRRPWVASIVT